MTSYVAFLRGINVGSRIIKMADLRACFEAAGMKQLETVLQSGNVLFECEMRPEALVPLLEKAVSAAFDYTARLQLYDAEALRTILDQCPYDTSDKNYHA